MRPTVHDPRVILKLQEDSIAIIVNKLMEQSISEIKPFIDKVIRVEDIEPQMAPELEIAVNLNVILLETEAN